MDSSARGRRDLLLCAAASLGAHTILCLLFAHVEIGSSMANMPGVPVSVETEEELELRLGILESEAETRNWLGFQTPTEHSGPESPLEQSAMTLEKAPEQPSNEPTEGDQEQGELLEEQRAMLLAWMDSVREAAGAAVEAVAKGRPAEESAPEETPIEREGADGQEETEADAREPAPTSAEESAVVAVPRSAREPAEGDPGVISDRESTPAALKAMPLVSPGRVVAAEGLEISTRRPRWSRATMVTRRPGNAVVWMIFGKDGRVKRAGFVRDKDRIYSTGFPDVDEPLLNAVYRWTAKGRALDELSDDPEDGVTVRLRVLLSG